MTGSLSFTKDTADRAQIAAHLLTCEAAFVPPLGARVDIGDYAGKIADQADRFEAWSDGELVGLVAIYCNRPGDEPAFVTNVSVVPAWHAKGVASRLMRQCIESVRKRGCSCIELEADSNNEAAINLYKRDGFTIYRSTDRSLLLRLDLRKTEPMKSARNYDAEFLDTEDHKYSYGFDFDVMHPYMLRSFKPFFRPGSLLELGSFKGDFTRRFREHFDDITCVEASGDAIGEARRKLGGTIDFVHSRFETAELPRRYDNVVLTHVLEHLDDPVRVLRRVNEEWLAEGGRFFLVCPNANAPSRQIAVKMGLISHNAAVTPAEAEHGHLITYSFDTLERDAVAAGLDVVHRSGIFFKALANFQWDRLLQTDIISKEYLEGCYQLGQQYPDLCSSIFLLCEAGVSERSTHG